MTTRLLALCLLVIPAAARSHPLGNFTINRQAALTIEPQSVVVQYVIDMAELPAFKEMRLVDRNGDGRIEPAERDLYLAAMSETLAHGLEINADGVRVPLTAGPRSLELAPGAGGLPTLRIDVTFTGKLPGTRGRLEVHDRNYEGRAGWQEIVARPGNGMALTDSTVPETDRSQALRAYPEDMLEAPLEVSEARLAFAPGVAARAATPTPEGTRAGANRFGDRLTALVADPRPLGPWVVFTSLLLAMALGAMHALTPGHGKTIVGAYLVGSRGTTWHAVLLGLIVTATHTLGVYALGLLALTAQRWFVPERLFPWLSAISGAIVVAIGASLTSARMKVALAGHEHGHDHHHHEHDHGHDHDHGHGHSHLPPPGAPVNLRNLVGLGVSGGLLPCPSALVVMLGAIALGRVVFGLVLIVAFSVGLAAVLTAIGVALVRARGLFDRLPLDGRVARFMPVASALVISVAGLAILAEALRRIGA
jgi:ABC-type nickel/cobalt efflux system permease component RcnA